MIVEYVFVVLELEQGVTCETVKIVSIHKDEAYAENALSDLFGDGKRGRIERHVLGY